MKPFEGIDWKDRQILFQLDEDGFQPASAIAKKTRLSKQVVGYRIAELQRKGVLRRCCVIVNEAKIGYTFFKFYLKYKSVDKKLEDEIIGFFNDHVDVGLLDTCDGRFDMFIGVWARDTHHLYKVYRELFGNYGKYFEDISVSIVETAYNSKRGYLIGERTRAEVPLFGGEIELTPKIDELDKKILAILSKDARSRLVDIAKELKVTPNAVSYRIKQLKESKVIQGARIVLDRNKLGFLSYKVLVKVDSFDEKELNRFLNHVTQHPNIIDIDLCMGDWNIELDVEIDDYDAFRKLMLELRTNFSNLIKSYDSLLVFHEHTYTYYPMGKEYCPIKS
ncbi:HTH-type transcriptional regulator Ptr2 [Candidatus Bilamarchaeum dharawalense]|uniref:HTH-type transcriptional regulator Ptr2 n=1 Tax=Candidatus Bilamarchaeum dharawalense TaxID=2885759 RepID=A0A5E4LU00_9ARCH|nr:HTH-type transcriptional regulator Ptr2 [Candidatus Bilamarchaeum dharawalense]